MWKHKLVFFASVSYLVLTAAVEQTCKNITSTSKYKGRYFGNTTINVTSSVSILTTPTVYACHHVCSGRTDCNALSYNRSRNQLMNCKLFNEKRYETHMVRDETSVAILLLPIHCGYNATRNGEWSSWLPSGGCYGDGNCLQLQKRKCVNPAICGGNECTGPSEREVLCGTNFTNMDIVNSDCEQISAHNTATDTCERALDGSIVGQIYTGRKQDPWWQVDLGTHRTIAAVVIYNSRGSPTELQNFLIKSQNQSESLGRVSPVQTQICVQQQPGTDELIRILACEPSYVTGRYIVIKMEGMFNLHIREVLLYGP